MSKIRLNKYIADSGLTSRRKADELILAGKVFVEGKKIDSLGLKIHPSSQLVEVDGTVLDRDSIQKIYLVFHKPRGCVTTLNDPEERPTVMDYCREINERIYPVGRLDYLSEGLLILTNDGDFSQQIIHPSSHLIRTYEVKVFGLVNQPLLKKLREGISIRGTKVRPKSVRIIGTLPNKTWLEFRIGEGKNREIRKLCWRNGLSVDKLKRVALGGLSISGIAPGKYHSYSKRQLEYALRGDYDSSKKTIRARSF